MKNIEEPKPEIEVVFLVNIKKLNEDDLEMKPQMITVRKDLYEKHLRIKAEYLNDYILCEDPDGQALKVVEETKIEPTIEVPLEIEDVPESEAFEPFVLQPLENFVDNSDPKIDFGENLIPKQDPEKPIKKNKQKIKAH